MKWNDIKNHMKKIASDVQMPPMTPAPAAANGAQPIMSASSRDRMQKWITIALIFVVIIAGGVIAYLLFWKKQPNTSPLSPKDAAYVQTFFDTNPPAQLQKNDLQFIQNYFKPAAAPAPTKTPTKAATQSKVKAK